MHGREQQFLDAVLSNPVNRAIVDRGSELLAPQWYLAAGAVFQTVWNVLDGRDPAAGIRDYDLFYFDDTDLGYDAENAVIESARQVFDDLDAEIEVRNQARVHLWYEEHFGVPGRQFRSCQDAIDHFASTTCCYAVRRDTDGNLETYAPHGFDDVFDMVIRPNRVLATQDVYETKARRWQGEWPNLTVIPW